MAGHCDDALSFTPFFSSNTGTLLAPKMLLANGYVSELAEKISMTAPSCKLLSCFLTPPILFGAKIMFARAVLRNGMRNALRFFQLHAAQLILFIRLSLH